MKIVTFLLFFGVFALLLLSPLSATGSDHDQIMQKARRGLVSDQIIGGAFSGDHGFLNTYSVQNPIQPLMATTQNGFTSSVRRPPFNGGSLMPPPWWAPPRRPPFASPYL